MQIIELLQLGEAELQSVQVPDYQLEARLLLEHCTGKSRTKLYLDSGCEAQQQHIDMYILLLERRKKREPIAYILGEQEFWSLPFFVSSHVLIPRPETEFLLDRVLALTSPENTHNGHILDLCCGSGVIATVLAKETGKQIYASDISTKALEVTKKNITRHCLESKVVLIRGNLLSPFSGAGKISLVVSNPPYVSSFDIVHSLEPEVAEYEPQLALDGGAKGLEVIKVIREELPGVLTPGGQCFIEIGADQGEAVKQLFLEKRVGLAGFQQVEILMDYAGRDRVLHARLEY